MSSLQKLKKQHEQNILKSVDPNAKQEKVWTPSTEGSGAHSPQGYQKQTAVVLSAPKTGPPPKKSISDLP